MLKPLRSFWKMLSSDGVLDTTYHYFVKFDGSQSVGTTDIRLSFRVAHRCYSILVLT